MKAITGTAAAAFMAAAALAPATSFAQSAEPWQFTGSLNLYLPTLDSSTVFPPPAGSSSASIDILEHLRFTFMGSLEARKGPWGMFTDLVYIELGADQAGSRDLQLGGMPLPANVAADVRWDLDGWSWTLGGTWRAVSKPGYSLDLVAGARLLDIEQKVGWTLTGNVGPVPLPDRTGMREASLSNWDAIVGVKGRANLGDSGKWFVPYYLDVGAGNSKLTTQAVAGLGYTFGWGEVVGSWRYLGYEMKSGQPLQELSFNGPMVSAVFHW